VIESNRDCGKLRAGEVMISKKTTWKKCENVWRRRKLSQAWVMNGPKIEIIDAYRHDIVHHEKIIG
jgi:hypothetical protein